MSFNKFSRTEMSKTVGLDWRDIVNPSLETIIALEKELDSSDPEVANKAMVRIFEYYRFMPSPMNKIQASTNDRICRICRERLG